MEVLHICCNMGIHDLRDVYARSPRPAPMAFGHTYQANHSCPCYNYKLLFYCDLILCTSPACFSTFYQRAMVPTLVDNSKLFLCTCA